MGIEVYMRFRNFVVIYFTVFLKNQTGRQTYIIHHVLLLFYQIPLSTTRQDGTTKISLMPSPEKCSILFCDSFLL